MERMGKMEQWVQPGQSVNQELAVTQGLKVSLVKSEQRE